MMKPLICIIFAVLLGVTQSEPSIEHIEKKSPMELDLDKSDEVYRTAVDAAKAAYRKEFAEAITKSSKIEVFLLESFTMKTEQAASDSAWAIRLPDDEFPVIPVCHVAKILKRKVLSADEIKILIPSLKATISVDKNHAGVLCHYPVHGIRAWDRDRIIFQTTISYVCGEFYMEYPIGESDFVSLSSTEFAEVLNQLMPIPSKKKDGEEAAPSDGKKPSK